MRYNQLETLRQYGMKILSEEEENEEVSRKYLEYLSRIAEQAYDERMSVQSYWMNKIQLEHNNFLAALSWGERCNPEMFSRLAANLAWFWGRFNNFSVAIEILERVVALKSENKETQARLNTGYGSLLLTTSDFQKASVLLKHGLSIWRELKNKKEEALTLANLADLTHGMGDDETGMKYSKNGYDLAIELNDPGVELHCMIVVVYGLVASKKTREARPLIKKALKLAEELDNLYLVEISHHMLGDCGLMEGKYDEAEQEYGLSLEATLKYGDKSYTCMEMVGLAMSVSGQGRFVKALRLNATVNKTASLFGYWIPEEVPQVFWHELIQQHIVGARKNLGEELTHKTEEEGRAMSLDEAVEYALNFEMD
jgi:tetratricopeptide (TPR) repeat protein